MQHTNRPAVYKDYIPENTPKSTTYYRLQKNLNTNQQKEQFDLEDYEELERIEPSFGMEQMEQMEDITMDNEQFVNILMEEINTTDEQQQFNVDHQSIFPKLREFMRIQTLHKQNEHLNDTQSCNSLYPGMIILFYKLNNDQKAKFQTLKLKF